MIELERTFLAREIPNGLRNCKSKEITDIYIPELSKHPVIRIRKNGTRFEMTKKEPTHGDASEQKEQTIILNEPEFNELSKLNGKRVHKIRYCYDYGGRTAEIDVFLGPLKGLILVDFEFNDKKEKDSFEIPDFCLAEITHKLFIAGGMLCGKSYEDIEEDLKKFNYKKLFLD